MAHLHRSGVVARGKTVYNVAIRLELFQQGSADIVLGLDFVRVELVVDAAGIDRRLDVHFEVEIVEDCLVKEKKKIYVLKSEQGNGCYQQGRRNDARASRGAHDHLDLVVVADDRGRGRGEGSLAWLDKVVWGRSDAKRIGLVGRGKVVHLVVEDDARSRHHL